MVALKRVLKMMEKKVSMNKKNLILILLLIVLVAVAYKFQHHLIGTPPTTTYSADSHSLEEGSAQAHVSEGENIQYNDPDILRLRELANSKPDDPLVWHSLGETLLRKVRAGVVPGKEGAMEAIDALRKAIDLDPSNSKPVLLMADLSFDLRAFRKAKEFFEQYLAMNPDAPLVKARYASTLTFLGKPELARDILSEVVETAPDNFQAHAFLTVAYAQLGEEEKARDWGDKALKLAPDKEAREKLEGFLLGIKEMSLVGENESNQLPTTPSLETYFKNHPIIGRKLVSYSESKDLVTLTVKEFPFEAMPDVAKEKLSQGMLSYLKENGLESDITTLVFVDSASKLELGRMSLKK